MLVNISALPQGAEMIWRVCEEPDAFQWRYPFADFWSR
jgi:hypothetical protein